MHDSNNLDVLLTPTIALMAKSKVLTEQSQ